MFRLLFLVSTAVCIQLSHAQTRLIVGAGYIENFHAGVSWKLKSYLHIETLAGNNFGFKNNITSLSQKIKFDVKFKKQTGQKYQLFGAFQATSWMFNNPYYKFVNLSFGPEIGCKIPVKNHNSNISMHIGYMYNSVLLYKRKTYSEVAWPKNWLPSMCIQWQIPFQK